VRSFTSARIASFAIESKWSCHRRLIEPDTRRISRGPVLVVGHEVAQRVGLLAKAAPWIVKAAAPGREAEGQAAEGTAVDGPRRVVGHAALHFMRCLEGNVFEARVLRNSRFVS
jgi:hypothetical protein